jgi:hypothetical protein
MLFLTLSYSEKAMVGHTVQSHYAEKVLSRFGYRECEPAPTPYDPSKLLKKNRRISRDQLRYS